MTSENTEESILKAISNPKRLEIMNYLIRVNNFANKSDLLNEFQLKRAGLDFHLSMKLKNYFQMY